MSPAVTLRSCDIGGRVLLTASDSDSSSRVLVTGVVFFSVLVALHGRCVEGGSSTPCRASVTFLNHQLLTSPLLCFHGCGTYSGGVDLSTDEQWTPASRVYIGVVCYRAHAMPYLKITDAKTRRCD